MCENVDCIQTAQDRTQWQPFANTVMYLRVPQVPIS